MADPLTTFDLLAVAGVVTALGGAVAILWKAFKSQVDELRKGRTADKAELADLVRRVRTLEEKRLDEVKEYATKLEAMSRQQMTVFSRAVSAIQDITRIVSGWMQRPCQMNSDGHALNPTPLPEIDTEILLRNDEKLKKHRQDEAGAA
jgi:hypothetical protein